MITSFLDCVLFKAEQYYNDELYTQAYCHYDDYFRKVFEFSSIPYDQSELDLSKEIYHFSTAFYKYLLKEQRVDALDFQQIDLIKVYLDKIEKKIQNEFIEQTKEIISVTREYMDIKKANQPSLKEFVDEVIQKHPPGRPKDAPIQYTFHGYIYKFGWVRTDGLKYVCKCGSDRHLGRSECKAFIILPYPFPTENIEDVQITVGNEPHTCNKKALLCRVLDDLKIREMVEEIYLSETPRPTRYQVISILNEKIKKETPEGQERQSVSEMLVNNIYTSLEKKHKIIDPDFSMMLKTERNTIFERFKYRFTSKKNPNMSDLIICYCSDFQKSHISESKYIFIDGTFDTAPEGFMQVLVLLGQTPNMNLPLSYILLPNKAQDTYERAFTLFLKEVNTNFHDGTTFITDFELGEFNAVKKCLMNSSHHLQLCFFHFCQSMTRHFSSYIDQDQELYSKLLSISKMLPFISESLVTEVIDELYKHKETQKFAVYFQDEYLDTFDFTDWNVSNKPSKDIITNNVAESHNNLLKRFIGSKPSLQQFEINIKKIENDYYNRYETKRFTPYEIKRVDEFTFKRKYKEFLTYLKRRHMNPFINNHSSDDEYFVEQPSFQIENDDKRHESNDDQIKEHESDNDQIKDDESDDDQIKDHGSDDDQIKVDESDDDQMKEHKSDDDQVKKHGLDHDQMGGQNSNDARVEKNHTKHTKAIERLNIKRMPETARQILVDKSNEYNNAPKRSTQRSKILKDTYQNIKFYVPNIDILQIKTFFFNNKNKK